MPDQNEKIGADVLAKVEALAKSPASADVTWQEVEDADHVTIERKLTARRGKWRVMSPDVEASARTRRGE
jgi:hypothetical protein